MESLSLQAVALSDGSTAYIQQAINDGNLVEGDTIQLEDGTTAYIQQVTVQPKDSLPFEDGQAVQLEDGTTAYIHRMPKDGYDPSAVEAVQLEDGSTVYIHHPSTLQTGGAILTVQTGGALDDLAAEADMISTLESYASQVRAWRTNKSQQGDKTFQCSYEGCRRLYTTAHHLKVHERSHTGDRPYRCEVASCTKAFATGYGLKSHLRTHTGEKPYKCPEDMCYKAFKTSGDLQKHLRTHTGEKPFKCPFEGCGRSFTTSNIRKVHMRTHTGERPYLCPEPSCGRGFASATNYKNHMRIHTGEKPYLCTVPGCGKRFTEYSSLYKHHVVHTHCKPYSCNHCGKTYRQTSTLAMHKRTDCTTLVCVCAKYNLENFSFLPHFAEIVFLFLVFLSFACVCVCVWALLSQVNLSDLQALGTGITMVTQDGTTITVPAHHSVISEKQQHVGMVTQDGKELQQVAIVTSTAIMPGGFNVSSSQCQQVALLATANGTQIAVQLEEQQTLEEAIGMATTDIQQGGLTQDQSEP
uniref:Transcription factor IIIA n=1 Tax=Electrophorus electricus TaxID=8005 RepID=A0AAY5EJT8_ELEEL